MDLREREDVATALGRAEPLGGASTAGYLDDLGRRAPLDPAEERRLVSAAQTGDAAARARLVDAFMPLISSAARVYRDSPQVERAELLQEGVVGPCARSSATTRTAGCRSGATPPSGCGRRCSSSWPS
jgi:DNA-directed RNA polymerase sigma subunit (sigma70/sigma32)